MFGFDPGKAQSISWNRRNFLRLATGAALAISPLRAWAPSRGSKAVVVTFGGGARDEETFMPDGQENIPHLLNELVAAALRPAYWLLTFNCLLSG